ncbi:hypothetical protein NUW58_g5960 [Xylaria curta]|uniref:Uncharacterized protein n=1 Tax=Xylaria curta TaxID=42375 RepID=A0ACC1P251_9PEZI|nr:hypothetical protein NUW58_g5960 [Xylaria curta]
MTDVMGEASEYHGSLVAFEGPQDIISTQLRLLPNSPKILILPSFQYFAKEDDANSSFDPRSQILRTHEACDARTEMARKFLLESTPDDKRLVFMNGGTASAQMSCITAISKHKTHGDFTKAEAIFNDLIQNGLAGLRQPSKPEGGAGGASNADATTNTDGEDDDGPNDPISKAMRAAEALDLETAFLQDPNELDLTTTVRPRSMSVPALPVAADLQNTEPFYVLGPTENTQKAPSPDAIGRGQLVYVEKWRTVAASEDQIIDPNTVSRPPSCVSEVYPYELLRPTSAVGPPRAKVESVPGSPALLGEARLVDIRSFTPPIHKRNKSVDRIYASGIRNQDISICNLTQSTLAKPEEPDCTQTNTQETENQATEKPMLRSNFYSESSYPTFINPNRAIVRKCLPPPLNLGNKEPEQSTSNVDQMVDPVREYVDQDAVTDPAPAMPDTESSSDYGLDVSEPFQTVLPMMEDLVIHFRVEGSEPNLAAMIQAFKHGRYPVSMPPLLTEPKRDADQPGTPTSRSSTRRSAEEDTGSSLQDVQESIPIYRPEEYDPFAHHGEYIRPYHTTYLPKQDISSQPHETSLVPTPPALTQTTSLGTNGPTDKIFHDFDLNECETAVCIQNSLRSILNVYFPSENMGYHQFSFPLLPELSSFWRPVFREIAYGDSKATRKIDLILAIGAQKGVKKGLLCAISSSLEKLGRESNGACQSGRLDMRYLIANTMQAFTSQPLTNQTQENPFSNPLLLATLILPHLETYIAAHSTTRFLILEYPPEYLSTVVALQHLIGVDLMKVAGIINAEGGDQNPSSAYKKPGFYKVAHSPTTLAGKATSPTLSSPKGFNSKFEATEMPRSPRRSFSKANFILTSTATESEIAALISTIWRILIEISPSYIPDEEPRPSSKRIPYDQSFSSPSRP